MSPRRDKPHVTATDVERALRKRYDAPAWAFLSQVRNGTGYERAKPRTADALAFSLWPSRGIELHGFEIKVGRGDVRRELADPAKAEDFVRFCDRWWLAVSDAELVQPGDLPPTWGLLVYQGDPESGGRVVCKVEAPKLDALPLDRVQTAAIFRAVHESTVPADEVQRTVAAQVAEAEKRFYDSNERELKEIKERVEEFEKASGVDLRKPWQGGERIGEAVRLILDHRNPTARASIDRLREEARGVLDALDAIAKATERAA